MAINQNHLFEELNGIKCGVVEKNASAGRTDFLRRILEYNRYTVVVVPSPPPKGVAAGAAAPGPVAAAVASPDAGPDAAAPSAGPDGAAVAGPDAAAAETVPLAPRPAPPPPPPPETFTIGVTDTAFNPTNAIFGRLLKTPDGHIVTLAYWQQKAAESHDEVPYFAT